MFSSQPKCPLSHTQFGTPYSTRFALKGDFGRGEKWEKGYCSAKEMGLRINPTFSSPCDLGQVGSLPWALGSLYVKCTKNL
jgi:hypothetical protein